MRLSSKKTMLLSSCSLAVVGLAYAAPAMAITGSAASAPTAMDNGNGCTIAMEWNLVGTTVDNTGNNADSFIIESRAVGGPHLATNSSGVIVPTTRLFSVGAFIQANGLRRDWEFALFDTTFGGGNAVEVAVESVPRATMVAAGGACASAVPSTLNAEAGPAQSVFNGASVTLDASGTVDPEGDSFTGVWTQLSGPSVTINNPTALQPTFTAPNVSQPTSATFQYTATDVTGITSTDVVVVSLLGPVNQAPVVDAGPDQTVAGGASVSLTGTATDPDNDPLTFQWVQVAGPAVTLTGGNTLTPTFTAPPRALNAQVLQFALDVSDGTTTATDTISITVPANQAPVANAGPAQNANGLAPVTLDATASSDPDGDPIIYNWTQISGTTVQLSGANTATPTFTAPQRTTFAQVLEFEVRVTDSFDASDTAIVQITVPQNQLPVADAGPDQNQAGLATVTLDGTGSTDPEGDVIEYSWIQTGGPSVTLNNPNSANPTFAAPAGTNASQVLTFQLTVTDEIASAGASSNRLGPSNPQQDTVQITILANNVPMADAGQAQTVDGNSAVTLDGSGSMDPDGDALTYSWVQTSGPSVTINGANTVAPTFTAPPKTNSTQALEFELTVADPSGATSTATVVVSVTANQLPLADAGPDQSVGGNSGVTLDGSGSTDPDGDQIFYTWVQTGGPTVILANANSVSPSFTAPQGIATTQTLTFQLTVTDDDGSGVPGGSSQERVAVNPQQDTVEITILANSPPVADAGADQGPVDAGQTVTLDGSGSSDPDGDTLGFTWTQVSGTPVTLTGGTTTAPTFIAPVVNGNEDLVFSLIVDDGQQQSAADTVTISVRAVGTVTIIQRVIGGDTPVTFTSDIAALNTSFTTSGGSGQVSAADVAAGSYTVSVNDLRTNGFALTDITCNDADSAVNVAARSVALELSPGEDLVCTFTTTNSRGAAQEAIADFLTGRNALILAHQPDLQRRLDRLDGNRAQGGSAVAFGLPVPGSGSLPFEMSHSRGQTSGATSLAMIQSALGAQDRPVSKFDIWGEVFFSDARLGSQDASFRIVHVGADYRIGDSILLGALAEFDDLNDSGDLEAGEAEGNGFLFGPYLMARLAPELFAEVRAAWGSSDNVVNPLGTFTDEFETNRSFYSGSLVGQFDIGDSTQVRPEFTVRYLDENQLAYTDSLGVIIPEQNVGQGDISFRPRFQHIINYESGWTLRPFVEAEGIYTFGTVTNSVLENGLRARLEGGLDVLSSNGIRASIGAFYDGIGADNFESSGAHISLSFGF
ncbi:MAG: autotransporter domain-containing protein [Pseudomonadota bacterium]